MRCLVTGASGHLGSYLTKLLLDRGDEVVALVRPTSNLWRLEGVLERVKLLRVDLQDLSIAADEIRREAADTVFHLAWSGVTSDTRNRGDYLITNVTGTLHLFQISQAAGCRCWIGMGSQAEYGCHSGVLREDLVPAPDTAYGMAKLCVGRLLGILCELSGIRYVWFRLLATYGPKDDLRHLIPATIDKLWAGLRPALTRGDQKWDYLYIEDAVEAIYRAAVTPGVQGVYNLASGEIHSVREIAERLRDLINPSLTLGFGEIPYAQNPVLDMRADTSRFEKATGWSPRIDLVSGLRKTVEWWSTSTRHESV